MPKKYNFRIQLVKLHMLKILKLIRIEQWIKNLLIFSVPIFAIEFKFQLFFDLLKVFFGFSLIASSGYIVNDIIDIESDKNHYRKKERMLASGKISISNAKIIFLIIFLIGSAVLFSVSNALLFLSLIYLILSILYSKYLKYIKFIDLITIATFFVIRVFLGSLASNIEASIYLNLLIFISSLTIVTSKKISILKDNNITNSKVKSSIADNYNLNLLNMIFIMSMCSTFLTFNLWVFLKYNFNIIFIISNILLILIFNKFYKLTNKSKTEDFIKILKLKSLFPIYILLFIFLTIIGILL